MEEEQRERPVDADGFGWAEFETWAAGLECAIGMYTEDWEPWWACWKAAYVAGIEEARRAL